MEPLFTKRITRSQKGGVLTLVCWLIVLVGGGLITIHVVPAYVEYYSVKTSINGIVSDPAEATKSPEEILLDLRKRLNVNNVTDVSDRDIVIKNSQGNLVITIHYHVKAHLFGRFSLLMDFKVKAPPGHS